MTEPEWTASSDPEAMARAAAGRLGDRKWRLFHCGCVRRVWHLLPDERLRTAIVTAELHADGRVDDRTYGRAVTDANRARRKGCDACWAAYSAARHEAGRATYRTDLVLSRCVAAIARRAEAERVPVERPHRLHLWTRWTDAGQQVLADAPAGWVDPEPVEPDRYRTRPTGRLVSDPGLAAAESVAQAAVLRDVVGPFNAVMIDPWYVTPAVAAVARGLYDAGDFHRVRDMGVALHAAGCDDAALLAHCFATTQHVRGCWAVALRVSRCHDEHRSGAKADALPSLCVRSLMNARACNMRAQGAVIARRITRYVQMMTA